MPTRVRLSVGPSLREALDVYLLPCCSCKELTCWVRLAVVYLDVHAFHARIARCTCCCNLLSTRNHVDQEPCKVSDSPPRHPERSASLH